MRGLCIIAGVLGMILGQSTLARAQLTMMREHERQMDSGRLGLGVDMSTFFGNTRGAGYSFVQPTLLAAVRVRELVIEGAMPFGYFHEDNQERANHNQFALGNPFAALAYLPDCECGLARLSLGVAVPLARAHSPHERLALALARGVQGDWDGYLWRSALLPLVFGAGTLKQLGRFQLMWDADLIVGLPGSSRDTEWGAQMAGEADVMFNWRTTLGVRLSGATYPTLPGDKFQSATMLFFRYRRTSDSFAVRFVLNLDPPGGFSFHPSGIWGAGLFYAHSLF